MLVAVLLVSASGLRLAGLAYPPLRFHPTRQYRSLIIARALFLDSSDVGPAAEAARSAARREARLEPTVMEHLTAWVYRLFGRELMPVGRVLAVGFWLFAALFVLDLGRSLGGYWGGLAALSVFLFVPFGVLASRSFQPDPLMILLVVASLWCLWRWWYHAQWSWLMAAGVVGGLAVFVKPLAIFFVVLPALVWTLEGGWHEASYRVRRSALFGGIVLLVGLPYYVFGLVGGWLAGQARMSFVPSLLYTAGFWRGWLIQVHTVVGSALLVCGLVGFLLFADNRPRHFVGSLWLAYVVMGLTFDYHISTHNYYSLPLVPIVALSVAPLGERLAAMLEQTWGSEQARLLLAGVLGVAVSLAAFPLLVRVTKPPDHRILERSGLIGEVVHHSSHCLFLAPFYGKPLEYHGLVAGRWWPNRVDLELERMTLGRPPAGPTARLTRYLEEGPADYFIVTDPWEFRLQPDLVRLLQARYTLVWSVRDAVVFDLHSPARR